MKKNTKPPVLVNSREAIEKAGLISRSRKSRNRELLAPVALSVVVGGRVAQILSSKCEASLSTVIASAITGATVGAVAGVKFYSKTTEVKLNNDRIKIEMKKIGDILRVEAWDNFELKNALQKNRYIFIDRKGRIIFTSRPKLFGIGLMRIRTKEIVD